MKKGETISVLNVHWGYSIGGVGKYAAIIEDVKDIVPVSMNTVCINCLSWHCDNETLKKLSARLITIKSRFDISWLWRLPKEIDRIRPDVIMTHGFNGHFITLVTRMFCKTSATYVCSYHGLYHAPSKLRKLVQPVFNGFTEFYIKYIANKVISVSDYSKRYLIERGVNPDKITVIHNGIDDAYDVPNEIRDKLRQEWGVAENEVLLGIASRLDPVKGISYLFDAFSKLCPDNDNLKLVIVGTGTLERVLAEKARALKLSDRIIFTGFRNDIDACLAAFDIFVLPSLAEYHSIALLEAMRAGKVIISTDVGGNTESVRDSQEALIVKPKNSQQIIDAVNRLLGDKGLCERLSSTANNRFKSHFTVDKMVEDTANWLLTSTDKL